MAADRQTTIATCWLLTLTDATVFGFTDHDTDLTVSAQLYTAAIGYLPSAIQNNVELSPDNMDVKGIIDDAGIKQADLLAGRFDYCEIEIFTVDYLNVAGGRVQTLIKGKLGKASVSQGQFTAELNSLASQLSQNIGRTFTTLCDADLGDSRCNPGDGYTLVADSVDVTSVDDKRNFYDSTLGQTDDYYNGGKVTWLTGDNDNYVMDVKDYTSGSGKFELYEAMPFTIQVGDTADIVRGCNKVGRLGDCKLVFDNYDNFRGFEDIPGMQKLMEGPN